MKTYYKVGLFVLTGVILGVGARAWDVGVRQRSAGAAEVESGQMVAVGVQGSDVTGAFDTMSALVGFELKEPSYLPPGNTVTGLSAPPDSHKRAFRYAQVAINGENGGFMLVQTNMPFAVPSRAEALPLSVTGIEGWRMEGPAGRKYYAVSPNGGFVVQVPMGSALADTDIEKVIHGLLEP